MANYRQNMTRCSKSISQNITCSRAYIAVLCLGILSVPAHRGGSSRRYKNAHYNPRRKSVSTRIKNFSLAMLLLGVIAVPASNAVAATCESLSGLSLSEAVSIEAKSFAGGTFQPPNPSGFVPTATRPFASAPISALPAFCEVSIVVAPQINIEVWLPLAGAWNHRFNGVGGGGCAGAISGSPPAGALEAGFAPAPPPPGHPPP